MAAPHRFIIGWLIVSALLPAAVSAQVDGARIGHADGEPDQWFTPGRDADGTYFSPLDSINAQNMTRLGFAWEYKLGTKRGLQGTPIVVDGVMYASGNWGRVSALDAATGHELWKYDPGVDGQYGRYACCDVVNRGLAMWKDRIYVASLDGYLHAIDARTGKRIWRVDTLPARGAHAFHYFITGAPVLAGDTIVIGNGGSDFKGARGSISAYDLQSGAFKWRFSRYRAIPVWESKTSPISTRRSRPGRATTTGPTVAVGRHGTASLTTPICNWSTSGPATRPLTTVSIEVTNYLPHRSSPFTLIQERWHGITRRSRRPLGLRFHQQIGACEPGDRRQESPSHYARAQGWLLLCP